MAGLGFDPRHLFCWRKRKLNSVKGNYAFLGLEMSSIYFIKSPWGIVLAFKSFNILLISFSWFYGLDLIFYAFMSFL